MFERGEHLLRTFSTIKGVPVYEVDTGAKVGEVTDLKLAGNQVDGLLIKQGALLKKTRQIEFADVSFFNSDGIFVDKSVLKPVKKSHQGSFTNQVAGKMLWSSTGEQLGLVEDVYFTEELGTIIGYECSDGFFSDIKEGKQVIQTDTPLQYEEDAIIVNVKDLRA